MELTKENRVFLDNEYCIMKAVAANESVSQRELSRNLGVSVSTINLLINKMIKEGLIKMTMVSKKQVLYMLTPEGMMEKAKKTVSYLKGHYRVVEESKEKIRLLLERLGQEDGAILVLMCDNVMDEILAMVVKEFRARHEGSQIRFIYDIDQMDINIYNPSVLLHMNASEETLKECSGLGNLRVINVVEIL